MEAIHQFLDYWINECVMLIQLVANYRNIFWKTEKETIPF